MKKYSLNTSMEVEAVQYTKENKQNELVIQCYLSRGEVCPVPGDLMGTPKDAFYGVETSDGWTKIELNDWIVIKNNENLVIPNGIFKLFFAPKD